MIERLKKLSGRDVPRETFELLEDYVALLIEEASKQNLIASSTMERVWERHIHDSAQIVRLAPPGRWVDIGSGAGLPGIVIAILTRDPVTLVEPRRLRTEFLATVKSRLALDNVTIVPGKATFLRAKFENITARAVAPASTLLAMTNHLSHPKTVWVLPRGRGAKKELDDVRAAWQGIFRLEASMTDERASILLATEIKPRKLR